ncbi:MULTISPECIES: hypothetical protein [unclassified Sphingobacterium]|uniref:hypothetical protein n=1 Tax=unclassified Sphingobacterium TaxID=2609468 RepID=UPI00105395B2|nr:MULTISPECIES: hypothetical protein [unclassified Sphingobacterium]MCS3556434.1 membrane-bound ClpP family serine protease [Sphingobacterium sp. JUb21]TCR08800.1 hypothetical protein EDF66_103352 [Sphingobacterium sp. JUb20]
MKNRDCPPSDFSLRLLMVAAIPAYVFPALMSFISAFVLQKTDLMMASYTTIGLSSLLSTILSFIILWQFELRQIFVRKKWVGSLLIILLMIGLGMLCTSLFKLQSERFNIITSAFLGATIITIRQHIKNYKNEKN